MTSKTQRLWFPLQPNNNFDPHYPVLKPYWRIRSAADFWMGVEAGILELGYYIVMRWPLQFIKLLTFLDLEQDFKRACRISICLRSQWNVRFFSFHIFKMYQTYHNTCKTGLKSPWLTFYRHFSRILTGLSVLKMD